MREGVRDEYRGAACLEKNPFRVLRVARDVVFFTKDEGRIHANAKRQHLKPSNDDLHFFWKHIPEQNPIVHQMHIFIKVVVIS